MTSTPRELKTAAVVAALGVVYGDIGTSPLYAFNEAVGGSHGVGTSEAAVLGVLSMIFWAVTVVVSFKYIVLVLRADNHGEGGVLALLAAVLRQMPLSARWRGPVIAAGMIGAAMFYGDSVITPAISVLSAVEGLEVVAPALHEYIVPVTVVILVLLFAVQRQGTARIGVVFGPVMLLWFATLGVLGAVQIVQHPAVLQALSPLHALGYAVLHPWTTFLVLSAVFLTLTGGEALYADMGHFGATPIRRAWFWLVMPCLLLNYFGQGALVLTHPDATRNPFFLLAPGWLQWPLLLLATVATVIASQAVISGAFSLTAQAVKLGYLPRMEILYTSESEAGQIYVPFVNWLLLAAVVMVVLGFGSSSSLAAAYGLAVSSTMVVTTLGVAVVASHRWGWRPSTLLLVFVPLGLLDLLFFAANSIKLTQGGWLPLALAAFLYFVFTTWKRGRELVQAELARGGIAMVPFLKSLSIYPPQRVEGTAIYMTPSADLVPHSLLHNLKHNRVLHERVIFLTAESETLPHLEPADMTQLRDLGDGCWHLRVRLGFKDAYDIHAIAKLLGRYHEIELLPNETSFFLSRQTVISGRPGGMADWRERLFAWMMHNAQSASDFFKMPPNRVIEIGTQVVI
jgi:KUP system potassium uptake protein